MALRNKKQPSELETMRAQRADLAERLAEADRIAKSADPVAEWEKVSKAASDYLALERAIYTLDQRIADAERLAAATARQEREAATAERKTAALQNVMAISEQIAQQAQQWRAGALADLDAAANELGHTGSMPPMAAAQALYITRAIDAALNNWRTYAPTWVGLPEPPSREELALAERRQRVIDAEKRLEDARKQAKEARGRFGSSSEWARVLETHAFGVKAARGLLLAMEAPDLSEDEIFSRSTSGLAGELESAIGRYWEARRMEKAKQQREAEAAALAA